MKRYTYYIIALLLTLTSCGNTEFEYSGYSCRFRFDNTGGRSAALASAIVADSPGIFCRVTLTGNYFNFESNHGLTDRVQLNAIDKQATIELGVYNATGIIVGYGNANYPFTFYAYDSQCPNCYRDTNLPRYSLTMSSDGTASCSSCGRKYNMNNDGIVVSGDAGDKLLRYRAYVNGNIVMVNN